MADHDQTWAQHRREGQEQERGGETGEQWRPERPVPIEAGQGRKLAHDTLVAKGLRHDPDSDIVVQEPERQLLVRLPAELHAALQREAKRRDLSQAQLLRKAIVRYLDGDGSPVWSSPAASVPETEGEPGAST